ncbi:MAG TPA: Hsp20/alpha crystallin family protein [Gammaproteobacteria bacterium]
MALVRYDPWAFMNQVQEDINRVFRSWAAADTTSVVADWVPAVDVAEYSDRFELFVDLPGVPADEVDITLERGVLTLSGERKPHNGKSEEPLSRRTERGHGRFYRRFLLPDTANVDGVKARENNGVLEITIPKQAAALPRRIKVAA